MLKLFLRAVAIGAAVAWGIFAWRAYTGPESPQAEEWRTVAFVLAFVCAAIGWTPKPPKPGSRRKERL